MPVDSRTRNLLDQSEKLFTDKKSLMALQQEIAEHFYPERAQFTAQWWIGRNMADNLTTSYPILCRRDLGNTLSYMTRPSDQQWFACSTSRPDREDGAAKKWLERATTTQRRAMYDTMSSYVRAKKERDHDYAAFGQSVGSCVLNRLANGLVFKCWHLRDMAWAENDESIVDFFARKWKPVIRDLTRQKGWQIADRITKAKEKEPFREVECKHLVVPIDQYEPPAGKKAPKTPYVSIFLDHENEQIMKEEGITNTIYSLDRWQTVSGSQYAYSPCTIAALPDARLIQAMTLVLLEAGEKGVTPPMVAPADVIRSDVQLYAGGITTYDADYDESKGEVLRTLPIDKSGFNFGIALRTDVKEMINNAFYLNKIGLPPIGRDMTAFEVGQRVSEYVRNALPLFQPLEMDSARDCELIFDVMFHAGGFGSPLDIPESIRGSDIRFNITSPLTAAIDAQKVQKFQQAQALTAEALQLDPTARVRINWKTAFKDALEGGGTPAEWINDDDEMNAAEQKIQQAAAMQAQVASIAQGADAANKVGTAAQNLGLMPPPGSAARAGTPVATGV